MQVKVEDQSSVKKVMHIEVDEKVVRSELDKAYQQLKKNAKVKGFRPGKTPRSVLERLYKKDVNADVTSRLIQESFVEAIKETDLKILGTPQVDPSELQATGNFTYKATVEIRPEIADIDFKGLQLNKTLYAVNDEEIDAQLQLLQKNMAQREPIKDQRPVKTDDFVLIDYEGFKDGKPHAETQKTDNFMLQIGAGTISKDFDDQLVGLQAGDEKEFSIVFPDDYFNKNLAGQEIAFKIKVNEIRKEVLPKLDDAFAKKVGQYKNLDELKEAIVDNLKQGYDKRSEQELNEQIFLGLIEKTDFELPEVLVKFELENILADAERSFQYYNKSMEDLGLTREGLEEQYRETAEKQVRRHLILSHIVDQEKLTLTDAEIDAGYQDVSANFNQKIDEIKAFYRQDPDRFEMFKQTLLEKKAIKLIIENSVIKDVKPEKISKKSDKISEPKK